MFRTVLLIAALAVVPAAAQAQECTISRVGNFAYMTCDPSPDDNPCGVGFAGGWACGQLNALRAQQLRLQNELLQQELEQYARPIDCDDPRNRAACGAD
jgi:hypothetical protein